MNMVYVDEDPIGENINLVNLKKRKSRRYIKASLLVNEIMWERIYLGIMNVWKVNEKKNKSSKKINGLKKEPNWMGERAIDIFV